MSGHGWVTPNADGSKARCGGPAICAQCALELAQTKPQEGQLRKTQQETYEQIVRELAESDPIIEHDYDGFLWYGCRHPGCKAEGTQYPDSDVPESAHGRGCLWFRAREAVGHE